jgi:dihydroflavonol-4-reductase
MATGEKTRAAKRRSRHTAAPRPKAKTGGGPLALRNGRARILVTGATGFLGAHLIRELRRRGAGPLRAMQSGPVPAWLGAEGVEVMRGSVTDEADLAAALAGVEQVYHLAGMVSLKPADAPRMYAVHVEGTRLLCRAALAAGVRRILLASTSGTIAVSAREDAGLDESGPAPVELIGRWPYYASKLYQEETARRACGDKVELVTINPSLLLGPGDDRLSSTRLVLQFLGREIALTPAGGLNFVDVRDVAALAPVVMERGTPGERYLVGGHNWSFAELFGRLERMTKIPGPLLKGRGQLPFLAARAQAAVYRRLGKTPPIEPAGVEMAGYYWYFDSTKAARELGFSARDATETLYDTVAYLRERFLGSKSAAG